MQAASPKLLRVFLPLREGSGDHGIKNLRLPFLPGSLLSIPLCLLLTCTNPWTQSDTCLWLAVVFLMTKTWGR